MKSVLLISNYVFHYRQKVYNYFADRFHEDGYDFHVLAPEYQQVDYALRFTAHTLPISLCGYTRKIKEIKPDAVILFLKLKDKIQPGLIYYCKWNHIPVIFWNKGVSDTDPHNPIKNAIYHHMHDACNALITYTSDMIPNFQQKNQKKLFIGWNTVNCTNIDKTKYEKLTLKKKHGIKEKMVILYVSRLLPTKRPEVLLNTMTNVPDVAVVMMGAGMTEELQTLVDAAPNLYYLGQKYGDEGNEVWAMGDIFSIPVNCGLGINEAIFWNMPIVTMNGFQPPEIYYVKEGKTGFITENEEEYKEKLLLLSRDKALLEHMKRECQAEYEAEVGIENMYQGFIDAVNYARGERK